MNLYVATISCELRAPKKSTIVHNPCLNGFRQAIAAQSQPEAAVSLQATFPWTFYKHVKVTWETIAENV